MDLILAKEHMTQPNEGIPHNRDQYDWSYSPVVCMGCNTLAYPSWYTGAKPTLDQMLAWFTLSRECGSRPTVNARVEIGTINLWARSIATGAWAQVDSSQVKGCDYNEANPVVEQPWNIRTEPDGNVSLKPANLFFGQGWGNMVNINPADLGGIYVELSHRVITDDTTKQDTRLTDKFVMTLGVDFYSPVGYVPKVNMNSFNSRTLQCKSDWRLSSGLVLI